MNRQYAKKDQTEGQEIALLKLQMQGDGLAGN